MHDTKRRQRTCRGNAGIDFLKVHVPTPENVNNSGRKNNKLISKGEKLLWHGITEHMPADTKEGKMSQAKQRRECKGWMRFLPDYVRNAGKNRKTRNMRKKMQKQRKKAAENNLPKLSGSEKQIAWANTIRMKFYEKYSNGQNDIETIISDKTEAKFWIDNRNYLDSSFIEEYSEKIKERQQHKEMVESNAVWPKEIKHDGIVEIIEQYKNMYDYRISLKYKKDAEFTALVKSCGYSWDGKEWYRKISRSTGKFKDMSEELGNKLLENGFAIYIQKDENAYIKLNEKAFNL